MKNKYKMTIWPLVFVISIGGFYFPKLGLIIFPMFIAIMILGFLKNRYWCGNICPRGAFFDLLLKHISIRDQIPDFFRNHFLQFFALVGLMSMFILNTVKAFNYWGSSVFLDKLGMVGVIMCAVTTFVGITLGLFVHQRTWCSFCPMGTVQKNLYRGRRKK